MASVLVLYGAGEGQTAAAADRLAGVLAERGHDVRAVDAADAAPEPSSFDAVVVGASVRAGHHQPAVRTWVREHRGALSALPTAMFQVSRPSATGGGRERAAGDVEAFLEETGWHPNRVGLFGGALRYSEYGFLERLVMRRIAGWPFPDAPREETEFTDWGEVAAFGDDVGAFFERRLGEQ